MRNILSISGMLLAVLGLSGCSAEPFGERVGANSEALVVKKVAAQGGLNGYIRTGA